MYSEKFNLSWNEFDNCASNTFKELLGETDFVDVTLVSDDLKQIKAHKVILGACSSKLKKMLQQNPQQHLIIYLTGVAYKEMQSLVNFMYLGQTEVDQDDLNLFMEVAAKFDVKGLAGWGKVHNEISTSHNEEKLILDKEVKLDEDDDFKNESMDLCTSYNTGIINYENENGIVPDENVALNRNYLQTSEKLLSCDQCDYKSHRPYSIKVHKNARHDGVNFPCDQCDYKSTYANNLTRHKKNQHN